MNTVTLITLIADTPESSPGSDYSEYKKTSSGQSSIESPLSEIKGSPININPNILTLILTLITIITLITYVITLLITRHTVTLSTLIAETPDVEQLSPGTTPEEKKKHKHVKNQGHFAKRSKGNPSSILITL